MEYWSFISYMMCKYNPILWVGFLLWKRKSLMLVKPICRFPWVMLLCHVKPNCQVHSHGDLCLCFCLMLVLQFCTQVFHLSWVGVPRLRWVPFVSGVWASSCWRTLVERLFFPYWIVLTPYKNEGLFLSLKFLCWCSKAGTTLSWSMLLFNEFLNWEVCTFQLSWAHLSVSVKGLDFFW